MIRKATNSSNKTRLTSYGFTPNQIKEKNLVDDSFTELYDFRRLVRVKNNKDRIVRYKGKKGHRKERKLKDPLDVGEKVLVIAERSKKKDAPGNLYKIR